MELYERGVSLRLVGRTDDLPSAGRVGLRDASGRRYACFHATGTWLADWDLAYVQHWFAPRPPDDVRALEVDLDGATLTIPLTSADG